ncbi:unnamed protein product [Schistosoma margrebowiei]|uniref:Uncharacterized protein n=1 Tax=Schistosoma margrebowiei TaxID=48269 RepID=A0A183MY65_9TREM|nr:unnamed protein product [Schistosoma margrebowiei]
MRQPCRITKKHPPLSVVNKSCGTTNKLIGKYSKSERPVKESEGKRDTEIQEKRNRCVGIFERLLNRLAPLNPSDIEADPTNLPIDVSPPTIEKIRMVIRHIRSGKSGVLDNIPPQAEGK